ncbi:MAG: GEVED domain-containing protein, partial [Thermoguttaceae bacterium]
MVAAINKASQVSGLFNVTAWSNSSASAATDSARVNLFGAATAVNIIGSVVVTIFGTAQSDDSGFDNLGDTNVAHPQGQVVIEDNQIMHARGYGITVAPDSLTAANDPSSPAPLLAGTWQDTVPGVTLINNLVAFSGHAPELVAPAGLLINEFDSFQLIGENQTVTFTFSNFLVPGPGVIGFAIGDSAIQTAANMIVAINSMQSILGITATAVPNTPDIILSGSVAIFININSQVTENVSAGAGGGIHISGNATARSNPQTVVPYVEVINNTLYGNGLSDANSTGIRIDNAAAATLMNNVVINYAQGIAVDASSAGETVVMESAYQGNGVNTVGVSEGADPIDLLPSDKVFLNPSPVNPNFIPAEFSKIIDSSLNWLADRTGVGSLTAVRTPLGIPPSPVVAPAADLYGETRVNDPNVHNNGSGLGQNVFVDRGAVDRVDFIGPTAAVIQPLDNSTDPSSYDWNPNNNDILLLGQTQLHQFTIQLSDAGTGVDDTTVVGTAVTLLRDGVAMVQGQDYFFDYNATNHDIDLLPASGIWDAGHTYTVILANTITDLSGNPLQGNRSDASTRFTITLSAGWNFGIAPDNGTQTYPTLLADNGARAIAIPGEYLGPAGTVESTSADAIPFPQTQPSQQQGITFNTQTLVPSEIVSMTVVASEAGVLQGWIDWPDASGNPTDSWDPVKDQITFTNAGGDQLHAGVNTLTFQVPATVNLPAVGYADTWARFRYSVSGGLQPTGLSTDGEVEDYPMHLSDYAYNFGDAPMLAVVPDPANPGSTITVNATMLPTGARHQLVQPDATQGLKLGTKISAETDGETHLANMPFGDDDGVLLNGSSLSGASLVRGQTDTLAVTVTYPVGAPAGYQPYLYGWVDWNGDGIWQTTEELPLSITDANGNSLANQALQPGTDYVSFTVPTTANLTKYGQPVWARFRLSTDQVLGPAGVATDGEVEDYQVNITDPPAQIEGRVFNTRNSAGLSGWTVTATDASSGNQYTTVSATGGAYDLQVPGGTYTISETVQAGWQEMSPVGGTYMVTVASLQLPVTGEDFGNQDSIAPTAVLSPVAPINSQGSTPVTLVVTYSDDQAMNVASMDSNDLLVTCPNGFSALATLVSTVPTTNGSPVAATYQVAAPAGGWSFATGGIYTVSMRANQVTDVNTNPVAAGALGTFTVAIQFPATLTVAKGQPNPTNSWPIHFVAWFAVPVNFNAGEVDLTQSTALGGLVATIGAPIPDTGDTGVSYDVYVTGMAGAGMVTADLLAGAVTGVAGNTNLAAGPASVAYGTAIGPSVAMITRMDPNPTNAAIVHWLVSFGTINSAGAYVPVPVTNVQAGDFTAATDRGGILSVFVPTPVAGSGVVGPGGVTYYSQYIVAASTGSGDAKINLNFYDDGTVTDMAGIPVTGDFIGTGAHDDSYQIYRTAPAVTINQAITQSDPATHGPINFTVIFSRAVTGFTGATLNNSALSEIITPVGNNGTTFNVAVNGMSGQGTLVATVAAGAAKDLAGNPCAASTSTDNSVSYNITQTTVTAISPVNGSVLGGSTTTFSLTFSGPVNAASMTAAAFLTSGVPATIGTPAEVGTSNTWQVPVTHTVSGALYFEASVPGAPIQDTSGTAVPAITWNYTVDDSPPAIISTSLPGGGTLAGTSPTIDLTFSEPVTGVTTSALTLAGPAAAAAAVTGVSSLGGNAYRFQLAGLTNGALKLTLTSAIQDLYGNAFVPLTWSATVDANGPAIASRTPTAGSVITGTSTNIVVAFGGPVSGVSAAALKLSGPAAASATVGAVSSLGNNTYQFAVSKLLGGPLTVTLGAPIADASGVVLSPVSWSYTVATPPTCIGTSLPGGGTLAGTSPTIDLTFSEPVTTGALGMTTSALTLAGPA